MLEPETYFPAQSDAPDPDLVRPIDFDPDSFGVYEEEQIRIYEHHRLRVDPGQEAVRVDIFLANRLKNASRSRIKNATLAGFVRVNNEVSKASYKLRPYDEVSAGT